MKTFVIEQSFGKKKKNNEKKENGKKQIENLLVHGK
jgi:hypothetical protein